MKRRRSSTIRKDKLLDSLERAAILHERLLELLEAAAIRLELSHEWLLSEAQQRGE